MQKIRLGMADKEIRDAVFSTKSSFYTSTEELNKEYKNKKWTYDFAIWTNEKVMKHFKRLVAAINQCKDNAEVKRTCERFCNKDDFELDEDVIALITQLEMIARQERDRDYIYVQWPRCLGPEPGAPEPSEPGEQITMFTGAA